MSGNVERLYDPDWFRCVVEGRNMTLRYTQLPVEEILVLDEMAAQYPGLRFNLRKQRANRYLLTILSVRHPSSEEAKGEP